MGHLKSGDSYLRQTVLIIRGLLSLLLHKHFVSNFQKVFDDLHRVAVRILWPVQSVLQICSVDARLTLFEQSIIRRDTDLIGPSGGILAVLSSNFVEFVLVLLHVLLSELLPVFLQAIQAMGCHFAEESSHSLVPLDVGHIGIYFGANELIIQSYYFVSEFPSRVVHRKVFQICCLCLIHILWRIYKLGRF